MMILCIFFEGVSSSGFFSIESESIFTGDIKRDILWFLKASDHNELLETMSIIFERSKGAPHFNFEVI